MYLRALLLQLGSMLLLQLRNLLFGGHQGSLYLLPPALLPISALGCKLHSSLSVMAPRTLPAQHQLNNKQLLGIMLTFSFCLRALRRPAFLGSSSVACGVTGTGAAGFSLRFFRLPANLSASASSSGTELMSLNSNLQATAWVRQLAQATALGPETSSPGHSHKFCRCSGRKTDLVTRLKTRSFSPLESGSVQEGTIA